MRMATKALGAVLVLIYSASCATAQGDVVTGEEFTWSESIASGAWLRIHNQNGSIDVRENSGNVAEVRAELRNGSASSEVRYEVVRDGSNVTICAMLAGSGTCTEEGLRNSGGNSWRRGSVRFTVLLPRGVKLRAASGSGNVSVENAGEEVVASSGSGSLRVLAASGPVSANTGSGSVEVSDAGGPVQARTGSGGVRISTSGGPVNASTGSGGINVRMRTLRSAEDMEFRTGSGQITIALPDDFQGEIDASTGSGSVSTDFPITIQGSMSRGRLRGSIGQGGPRIRLSTGSGGISLERAQ